MDLKELSPEVFEDIRKIFSNIGTSKYLMINGVVLTQESFDSRYLHGNSYSNTSDEAILKELFDDKADGRFKRNSKPYIVRFNDNRAIIKKNETSKVDSSYLWDSIINYLTNDNLENYFTPNMIKDKEIIKRIKVEDIVDFNTIHLMSPEYEMFRNMCSGYIYESGSSNKMNFDNGKVNVYNTLMVDQLLQSNDSLREHLIKAYILDYKSIILKYLQSDNKRRSLYLYSGMFCPVRIACPKILINHSIYDYYFSGRIEKYNYVEFSRDHTFFESESIPRLVNSDMRTVISYDINSDLLVSITFRTHKEISKFLGTRFLAFSPRLLFTVMSKNIRNEYIRIEPRKDRLSLPLRLEEDGNYYRRTSSRELKNVPVNLSDTLQVNSFFMVLTSEFKNLRPLVGKIYDRFEKSFNPDEYVSIYDTKEALVAFLYVLYYREIADKVFDIR